MEIEYIYKNKKFKDEGLIIRITTDSGIVKAICPKNPLAVWAVTYGKHLTPVFQLDKTPFIVEYVGKERKSTSIGQLLYDLSKRRTVKEYSTQYSTGRVVTRVFKSWIATNSVGFKGEVKIL
jgi:hypothetical protein